MNGNLSTYVSLICAIAAQGVVQALRVLRAAGATRVGINQPGVRWDATGDEAADDAAFEDVVKTAAAKGGHLASARQSGYEVKH